jgi:hypothetical protein
VKTARDWVFNSNRHFLHWIAYLEADHEVETFELATTQAGSNALSGGVGEDFDAKVYLRNGGVVWHKIVTGELPAHGPSELKRNVRIVTEEDIRSRSLMSMRWLKVICFAGALRSERQAAITAAVLQIIRSREHGVVRDILEPLQSYDDATVKGVLARLAIKDALVLDLSEAGFTPETPWTWEGT